MAPSKTTNSNSLSSLKNLLTEQTQFKKRVYAVKVPGVNEAEQFLTWVLEKNCGGEEIKLLTASITLFASFQA